MPIPPREVAVVDPPKDLTVAEALAVVAELAPQIRAEAPETEERTFYSEDLHLSFMRAGLYNLLRPRTFGGYEFPIAAYLKVVREIARADMSTAWGFCLASAHVLWMASWWPEEAQREFFASAHTAACGTSAPGGRMTKVDGGWIVNGVFPYASGGAYSTHFLGHVFPVNEDGSQGPLSVFMAPRDIWTVRDDWGKTLGLKGSSSHTVEITDGFVPDSHVLLGKAITDIAVDDGTPGYALHKNPIYNGRGLSTFTLELASLGVGGALGALDQYREVITTKRTALPPITLRSENPTYQLWYADAATRLQVAEATLDAAAEQFTECATRAAKGEGSFSLTDDAGIGRCAYTAQAAAWQVLEGTLMKTSGSSHLVNGSRMERIWRDFSMLHSHQNTIVQDITAPIYGSALLTTAS
ncbi:acyl-CoA dehydrogenase family protein [Gordonia aichiensis]|uniref:Putative hydroxylase n=1 Tax=Gordonia aichiensis NBRC 108223 TaxID=1220583 RepID=L7KCV3_9ACTN|nr:acyl-CoA dehydrogenase family protein [Gordonia aichiensis]GAC46700.1 putative hydroxylase [Gordonia aichiensis NBRC 108223]